MAAWDVDYPADSVLANTLHTVMQTVKGLLGERMKARSSDNTIDEHNVCQTGEDGIHPISKVGFVKKHTTYASFLTWFTTPSNKVAGSLHYCVDTASVYMIDEFLAIKLCTIKDHSLLQELTDLLCHLDLFALDGSRAMQGDIHFASGKGITGATYGTDTDDDALNPTHISQTWYDAHGADMLQERHWPGGLLDVAMLRFERKNLNDSQKHYLLDPTLDLFSFAFPSSQSSTIVGQSVGRDGSGWFIAWLASSVNGRTHVWYGASG